ncbi:MAG TPA: hypothetical protein VGM19_09870 [Armatimonadota bacterium]|jgi:hypothetical protein
MGLAIGLFLAVLAAVLLWVGSRAWRQVIRSVGTAAAPAAAEPRPVGDTLVPVQADALVYLFAGSFVRPPKAGRAVNPRFQARAPLTDEELDPRDWAAKMLYVLLAELVERGQVEFLITERVPTLMPPFPHKNWEMQIRRTAPLLPSPLSDCLGVAFDTLEKRSKAAEADPEGSRDEATSRPGEAPWFPLDLVLERMLQVVRAETTFWQREGVYGDLRNYVADSLVALGYLIEITGNTWIETLRRRRLDPNIPAIEKLAPSAETLLQRVRSIRQRYGSSAFLGESERDASYTHLNAPASLTQVEGDVTQILWADALGISLYEILVAIRQLEPTGEGGV